jgi:hypothetical protein
MKCEVKQKLNSRLKNDTMKPSVIESEEKRNVKIKFEVKHELNIVIVRE